MDTEVLQRVGDLTIHQVKGMLVKSKVELQEASNQIKSLKEELKLQQQYYEKTMLEDTLEKQSLTQQNNDQNSQSAQYKLMTAIESKNKKITSLESSLNELNEEKESAAVEIANLRNELKL